MKEQKTAYQVLNHHLSKFGLTSSVAQAGVLIAAMQEYSDQQNAELDKMAEQLSAENSHLSSIIEGLKIDKEWLSERVKELETQNKRLKIAHYTIVRAYEEYGPLASVSTKQVSENVLKEVCFDPSKETI